MLPLVVDELITLYGRNTAVVSWAIGLFFFVYLLRRIFSKTF